jgi:glycine betaine catabolism A
MTTDDLGPPPWPTLPGVDYHDEQVYRLEQQRVFGGSWFCLGRSASLPDPGDFATPEVAGEKIVVVRGRDDRLRAFANSCRHRGTLLLEGTGNTGGAIRCPYHAWAYTLDGRLRATPNVGPEDGVDREQLGLWPVSLAEWGGFHFVNLGGQASPLAEQLTEQPDSPLELERYRLDELRVGARREYVVAANWKIVVENYYECLHCPTVHPELVAIVPQYRNGEVEEEGQSPLGNSMGPGLTSFTMTGHSTLPSLPGLSDHDLHTFYGAHLFPNLIINYHSETVNAVTVFPDGPQRSRVVSEYLFRPETIASDGFDPSEVVDFRHLVAQQDWLVCERAQQGVTSRFYRHGVYPRQERAIVAFNRRYLELRGPVPSSG